MNRIQARFQQLRESGRTALIPYITAGDPEPTRTVPLMHSLVAAGADLVELGVPFSDPMADGPVIQRASERALTHDVSLADVLDMVAEFRRHDTKTPVVLMGYLNPIEVMGYRCFAGTAAQSGVDGVLTVDSPPQESVLLDAALRTGGLDPIYMLAPTSTSARVREVTDAASGFVYYVALKGVTGAANLNLNDVESRVAQIQRTTTLPISVGFGIKCAADAARVSHFADAVVVGSALVEVIEANLHQPLCMEGSLAKVLSDMRTAMDREQRHIAAAVKDNELVRAG